MPSRELIAPHDAVSRLAFTWNIPHSVADQIVWDALMDEKCYVRNRFGGSMRDVRKELAKALAAAMSWSYFRSSLLVLPHDFERVELDWHDLIKHGRSLVPPEYEYAVAATEADVLPVLQSNDEVRAVEYLVPRLEKNPTIQREDARKMLGKRFRTSKRGFVQRVWPNARAGAGLSAAAPPGPKRKQNRRR